MDEARRRILHLVDRLDAELSPLDDALGQVLAVDAVSPLTVPPADNSAMDGYAVRAADIAGASAGTPRYLTVVGQAQAGHAVEAVVSDGTAVRIMTGAAIPPGADAVVPFEDTDEAQEGRFGAYTRGSGQVGIRAEVQRGANIRYAGEDIRQGEVVVAAGTELRPSHIGVLASIGLARVQVYRRPVIALISTGDELLQLGEEPQPGRIYDSNIHSVAAQVREAGGIPLMLGIARDTVDDVRTRLQQALEADMVITSAGVSRGDFDVVKDVLLREGDIDLWTVNMRPGKPLAFGWLRAGERRVPHLGLPGNPVSSMIGFELFGRPAVYKMAGRRGWQRPVINVTVGSRIVSSREPRHYIRCVVTRTPEGLVAVPTGSQSSGILTSMSRANALVICPEGVGGYEVGETAQAMLLAPADEQFDDEVQG